MTYSFEKLCLSHYQELIAFATRRTKSKAAAEDIVQDAVIRALTAWDRWEPKGDPNVQARAWMFRIVGGAFANYYQHNKVFDRISTERHAEISEELFQERESEHPYFKVDSIGDEVHEALDRIKPEWSDVVRLVYIQGIPASNVAKLLKIAPGTVRSRMARGRLALARILSPLAKQRFGYSSSANEAELAVEPAEAPEPYTTSVHGIITDYDGNLLGLA